ncbi:uncharacterized protein [Halyomorpha halys]|uniref:uncharacterized protein n=1 Tax=Halyomorpha halys TaxID=286706 RepID=UPI0006D4F6E0|nr:uncharacterized protein LOC106690065 [Halyomorpha halys]
MEVSKRLVINMKPFLQFVLLMILAIVELSYGNVGDRLGNVSGSKRCPMPCPDNWSPICGQMLVNGTLVFKMFPNVCDMVNANECEGGHYEPCRRGCDLRCECVNQR